MKFLCHIPGFRSRAKWKMVIATLYYLFALLLLLVEWSVGLFFLAAPFCIFSLVDLCQHRKKTVSILKASLIFILSLIILVISVAAFPENTSPGSLSAQNEEISTQNEPGEGGNDEGNVKPGQQAVNEKTGDNNISNNDGSITKDNDDNITSIDNNDVTVNNEKPGEPQEIASSNTGPSGTLKVHFLDVGQADCILVQAPEKTMLIDAGNNADSSLILSYLKNLKINRIDVLIGTHPHEDHIGSMDDVIESFDIGSIYMPKVSTTTKTFEDVLLVIKNKGLKVNTAKAGVSLDLGKDVKAEIIAPNSDNYEDINNYSAVIKLTYGETSFLFAGDAETVSEKEMLAKGYDLKSDVLKVGHHGSTSSTSPAFLKSVSPKYAVISVGKDNQYGHPDSIIINRLKTFGVEVLRTDESGTIIAATDGKSITFSQIASPKETQGPAVGPGTHTENLGKQAGKADNKTEEIGNQTGKADNQTEKEVLKEDSEKKDVTVYITKSGKKYHSAGCQYLSESKVPIMLSEAKAKGYTPCSRCTPPR